MKILEYVGLDTSRVAPAYARITQAIARGDFRATQVTKLTSVSHGTFYRARLNDADRLLFSMVRHGDETCALMLELIANHDYDGSRFLRGARDLYYANGFEHPGQDATFLSYREFVESIRVSAGREASWRDFSGWFARMRPAFRDIDGHQAFEEIRGVSAAADGEVVLLSDKEGVRNDLDRRIRQSTRFVGLVMRDEDKAEARRHFAAPLLLSIHEAKGLEYENVVLFRFVSDHQAEYSGIAEGVAPEDLLADTLELQGKPEQADAIRQTILKQTPVPWPVLIQNSLDSTAAMSGSLAC